MSIFSNISAPKLKFSNFNLSEEMKCSMGIGDLVPILCKEVLPSDSFKVSTELLIKFAPLKAPVMHRIKAYVHYFFVPTFQINSVFQDFINPKVNSDNSIIPPYIPPSAIKVYGASGDNTLLNSLADYLGLPVTSVSWLSQTAAQGGFVSVDPFRAYQHIYNCYYRDQNCEPDGDSSLFPIDKYQGNSGNIFNPMSSDEITALLKLRKRAWAKDYFTSALPSPQAGDDVLIPMQSVVQADGSLKFDATEFGVPEQNIRSEESHDGDPFGLVVTDEEDTDALLKYHSGLKAINSTTTINDLRRALALQRFKELAERGGTRYSEMVRNFFGSFLKDYWVDRPIYLGGQVQPIKVGEVFQTSQTTTGSGASALATRAGAAQSYGRTKGVYLKAPCHGFLMGILSVRPEATYQQGIERMWSRKSIFDFAFPQFARMGEQEILNKEIYAQGNTQDDGIFGYAPRYAEYKTGHCHVCSEFRTSLSYWHFGRKFNELPTLSKEFVMMDNVSTDPFNVVDASEPKLYVDLYNIIYARRPLPYFGNPSVV